MYVQEKFLESVPVSYTLDYLKGKLSDAVIEIKLNQVFKRYFVKTNIISDTLIFIPLKNILSYWNKTFNNIFYFFKNFSIFLLRSFKNLQEIFSKTFKNFILFPYQILIQDLIRNIFLLIFKIW